MIEWEVEHDHLRVIDADNAEMSVWGEGLAVDGHGTDIPRPVDETIATSVRELRFPNAVVYVSSLDAEDQYELDPCGEPLSLPPGEYVVDADTEIKTYFQFSGAATIHRSDDFTTLIISFPDRTQVTLGFRSRHELPTGTITVPETPEAFASIITHLASSHKTDGSDRTYPTLRGHPPLVELGDELQVPQHIRAATLRSGIELRIPPTYESLFVAAPLAYYLQATINCCSRSSPALTLPSLGIERELAPMPDFERDVEQLLRKTFFLDCLIRNAGPYGTHLEESSLLEPLELHADELYEASPQERLATYLDVPYAAIEHRLPKWHLATYVEPMAASVEVIPFLLDRLSLVYTPQTSKLEGGELVERSLEEFYRGYHPRPGAGKVASVDIVKPELRSGQIHGWLADGVPIDVFKSASAAYHNRLEYLNETSEGTSICVVLNDPQMSGEHERVASIYRQRSTELTLTVDVKESLSTAELARVFESEYDFVHYIGHCETDGLRCRDGYLATSTLERCSVQTFFLNACGSFYEGMDLIKRGSVAGAVTFTQVLNEHAIKVGSMFAKLLVHGFSIERALRLARRRIMMGKDYAVVGDGTHSLTHGDHRFPTTVVVDKLEDDRYLLTLECYSARATGSYYFPQTEKNNSAYLCGTESSFTLTRQEFIEFLKNSEASVVYEDDLYWSKALWPRLAQ